MLIVRIVNSEVSGRLSCEDAKRDDERGPRAAARTLTMPEENAEGPIISVGTMLLNPIIKELGMLFCITCPETPEPIIIGRNPN